MKLIKDLTPKEIQLILKTLEEDGFVDIVNNGKTISFAEKSSCRAYNLVSTDIENNEDLGLRMEFDFDKFLEENYFHKTRHSVSFENALEAQGGTEDACHSLDWQILDSKNLNTVNSEWSHSLYSEFIHEVMISGTPHILINEKVYQGELSKIWTVGTSTAQDLLSNYKIFNLLKELNQN